MQAPRAAPPKLEEMKAKVVLAGAPGVGKTSLVRRYVLNAFHEGYGSTLGAVVYKRVAEVPVGTQTVRVTMTLWDVAGEPGVPNAVRDLDLFGAQGILIVCDATDARTLTPLERRLAAATQVAGSIPVEILLNKADLGAAEEVRTEGLRTGLIRGIPCYLTSAKTGDNVVRAFEDLARRMIEHTLLPDSRRLDGVDRQLLIDCAATPQSADEVARRHRIPAIFAEARLERLRRQGFLCLAALGLDDTGRPLASYGRTRRPFGRELLAIGEDGSVVHDPGRPEEP